MQLCRTFYYVLVSRARRIGPLLEAAQFTRSLALVICQLLYSIYLLLDLCFFGTRRVEISFHTDGNFLDLRCDAALDLREFGPALGNTRIPIPIPLSEIRYTAGDFRDEVLKLTNGRGVDRVYDPVGGDVFTQSLCCMAVEGRICPIGFAGGTIPQIPANILLVKSIAVMGFNYGYYVGWSPHDARLEQADRTFALMERIRGWCEAGQCRPHVDRTFRLDQAAEAMRALLERQVTGRVAISMD